MKEIKDSKGFDLRTFLILARMNMNIPKPANDGPCIKIVKGLSRTSHWIEEICIYAEKLNKHRPVPQRLFNNLNCRAVDILYESLSELQKAAKNHQFFPSRPFPIITLSQVGDCQFCCWESIIKGVAEIYDGEKD
jgi:hypothetical protein